jgi:hypothetical protein
MDRSIESSAGRSAARFAATYTAWRRRRREPPRAIAAAFAPWSLDELRERCRPRTPAPDAEDPEQFRCRRAVVATLAGGGVEDRALENLMYQQEQTALAAIKSSCRHCDAWRSMNLVKGLAAPVPTSHASITIDFDPDTFVSSARVDGFEVELSTAEVEALFARADPRNWSRYSSALFKRSDPGLWTAGGWQERPWEREDGGEIYELVVSPINETFAIEIHNVLTISAFHDDLSARARAARPIADARSLTLMFEYALQQNLGTKLGFVWEPEGIDIDNGFYRADARRLGVEERWRVSISVEKRLRYTIPQTAPQEIGAVLNVMSPAFLSLFMHEYVYGAVRDLDRGP